MRKLGGRATWERAARESWAPAVRKTGLWRRELWPSNAGEWRASNAREVGGSCSTREGVGRLQCKGRCGEVHWGLGSCTCDIVDPASDSAVG